MQRAFSLVELSIVLVILGLLTGGILAGQSLIKASQLRSVSTDYGRYMTAMTAFRDKYFGLPGDITNAQKFWGADPGGCPGDNTTTTTPRSTTCNGDGNGRIELVDVTSALTNEPYRVWQHLADAGLIEGSFTGVPNTTTAGAFALSTTTPNVPASKIPNALWLYVYIGTVDYTSTGLFDGDYGNALSIGTGGNGRSPALIPEDAWNIDTKMDDGKPGTGRITSRKNATQANSATGCSNVDYTVASSIAASSAYLLTNTSVICSLIFKTGI